MKVFQRPPIGKTKARATSATHPLASYSSVLVHCALLPCRRCDFFYPLVFVNRSSVHVLTLRV
eukprot:5509923-Pleurochrysis_carterae.AAC.1